MNIQQIFLYKAYHQFKLLFATVALWAVGTLWYALHSHEEFPFLLFGMYSLKQEAKTEYTQYALITTDGKDFIYANLKDPQRELLQNGMVQVVADTNAAPAFSKWVTQHITGGQIFTVVQRNYTYNASGQPVNTSTQQVYPYDKP